MARRVLTACFVLFALTGFVTACGGDDDDDGDVAADDSSEEVASSITEFCDDFTSSSSGFDTPVDEVQHSADLAAAAAEDAPEEISSSISALAEFAQAAVDGSDGDTVTADQVQELVTSTEGLEDDLGAVTEYCSDPSRKNMGGAAS